MVWPPSGGVGRVGVLVESKGTGVPSVGAPGFGSSEPPELFKIKYGRGKGIVINEIDKCTESKDKSSSYTSGNYNSDGYTGQ